MKVKGRRKVLAALADLLEGRMIFVDFCVLASRAGLDCEVRDGAGSIVYSLGTVKDRGVDVAVTLTPSRRTGT